MDPGRPVVMFCGKLQPHKRPLDLAEAVAALPSPVSTLFVGDGPLAAELRSRLCAGHGAVTGFVNQSELPALYRAADILVLPSSDEPWGLVVNEAMAAGALPVVSDRVGAGPDLVHGLGEVYPCGDVTRLTAALAQALARIGDPRLPELIRGRVARYSLDETAQGFEQAAFAARRPPATAGHPRERDASRRSGGHATHTERALDPDKQERDADAVSPDCDNGSGWASGLVPPAKALSCA
jgi:glycosyltransferase involved in cell wall biosynthesis